MRFGRASLRCCESVCGCAVRLLALQFLFHVRILRVHLEKPHVFDGDIDVVGRVKPAAPEPVEIRAGSVFHRAEKIGGHRALEFPALRVLS